jgi:hypothetical protein
MIKVYKVYTVFDGKFEVDIKVYEKRTNELVCQYDDIAPLLRLLEELIEGEYRIFHSDSMDQNTQLEEEASELYKELVQKSGET